MFFLSIFDGGDFGLFYALVGERLHRGSLWWPSCQGSPVLIYD